MGGQAVVKFVSRNLRLVAVAPPALPGNGIADNGGFCRRNGIDCLVQVLLRRAKVMFRIRRPNADSQDAVNNAWVAEKLVWNPNEYQRVLQDIGMSQQSRPSACAGHWSVEHRLNDMCG